MNVANCIKRPLIAYNLCVQVQCLNHKSVTGHVSYCARLHMELNSQFANHKQAEIYKPYCSRIESIDISSIPIENFHKTNFHSLSWELDANTFSESLSQTAQSQSLLKSPLD